MFKKIQQIVLKSVWGSKHCRTEPILGTLKQLEFEKENTYKRY
jgi:hypothetical protein